MKVLSSPLPYLCEWNLQRYTAVPLRGSTPSVLWSHGVFFCLFVCLFVFSLSAARSVCLGDKSVARSLPACTVWAPALKLAVDPADPRAPRWRETKSVFEILACSHLPQFVIASNPAQPSYTSVSAPLPALQLCQTGSHRPKHIKDTALAQHMN